MGFRRNGKAAHDRARQWRLWLEAHAKLLRQCGLPASVLCSRKDWDYLLRYGYHCRAAYPDIDFRLEELSSSQRNAFRELLEQTLSAEDKQGGNAAWHFVCPPAPPEGKAEPSAAAGRGRS
jgi:hypothetical protein